MSTPPAVLSEVAAEESEFYALVNEVEELEQLSLTNDTNIDQPTTSVPRA